MGEDSTLIKNILKEIRDEEKSNKKLLHRDSDIEKKVVMNAYKSENFEKKKEKLTNKPGIMSVLKEKVIYSFAVFVITFVFSNKFVRNTILNVIPNALSEGNLTLMGQLYLSAIVSILFLVLSFFLRL